jgi:N-acetylglucosaminyl-diphospho-decaprenol L-rhamnosyltransferase
MKLLIVILNYKTAALAIDCLASLATEPLAERGCQVVLVDNASGGETEATLAGAIAEHDWSSWVRLLVNTVNLGFTGGNNCVVRPALAAADPPEFVLLLNSDTVVQPGAIGALIDFMDSHPRAGIGSSQLLSPEGAILSSAFRFPGLASELDLALRLGPVSKLLSRWRVVLPLPAGPCQADWVPGASMILRAALLREIGLLDEAFFTYFEDVDVCWRARRNGWEVWYIPASRVMHIEGASSGIAPSSRKRRPAYWFQARRRYFLKNYGPWRSAAIDAAVILGTASWRLRRYLQRKPDTDPAHLLSDCITHSVFVAGFEPPEVTPPSG